MKSCHPGLILKRHFLEPLDIHLPDLATGMAVDVAALTILCEGRCPLSPEMAVRLALYFDVPVNWWLEMQLRWEVAQVDIDSLREVVTPFPVLGRAIVSPSGARWLEAVEMSGPVALVVDRTLLERLRAMTALEPKRPERELHQETYDNGLRALIGRDP